MLKNLEMLLRSAELTHASNKFDFTTKEFGTDKEIRSQELRRCAAVANQLAAAWMWLAGAIPLSALHSNSLLYLLLFWETHDLVWEKNSVSEKRMKNCIATKKWRRWFISFKRKESTHNCFWPPSQCLGKCAVGKYLTRAPLGGYFEPSSGFLVISSKPMQVSPLNLQNPLS